VKKFFSLRASIMCKITFHMPSMTLAAKISSHRPD
jgi:hypothetical protein